MTDTRTPAPASADAMGVFEEAYAALRFSGNTAAARIIQQYGDQREAAGFRRGVEHSTNVAANFKEPRHDD